MAGEPAAGPAQAGRGPLAFRLHLAPEFDGGPVAGFDLTEAGTQKRLAVYLVRDPADVPGIARLGPDALDPALTEERLGELLSRHSGQIKGVLTDQTSSAGSATPTPTRSCTPPGCPRSRSRRS